MKEKIISIHQIKEAKRLHKALEITTLGPITVTLTEMLDKVVEMDRQSEIEFAAYRFTKNENKLGATQIGK